MKKYKNVLIFAAIVALVVVPVHAAEGGSGLCALINKMQDVFKLLRILAFVGAGFYMAGWAWEFISKGEAKFEDVKKRGIGLLVGFTLLFTIGIVLSFLLSAAGQGGSLGCEVTGW